MIFFLALSFFGKTNTAFSSELNDNNDQENIKRINPLTIISKNAFGLMLQKLDESNLLSVAQVCKAFRAVASGVITKKLQERLQGLPKIFGKNIGGNIQRELKDKPPAFYARALKDLTDDPEFTLNLFVEHQDQLMGMKLEPLNLFFLVFNAQKLTSRKFAVKRMLPYERRAIISKLSKIPLNEREAFIIQVRKILTNEPVAYEIIGTIEELSEVPLNEREAFVRCVQHFLKMKKFTCYEKVNLLLKINAQKLYKKAILISDPITGEPYKKEKSCNLNDLVENKKKKRCVLQ